MTTEALGAEPSNARTLLRAVGLQAVHSRKHHAEEPKILIDTSRRRILLRSMVHVLPIVAAIGISYLNLTNKFVGHGFLNQYTSGDAAGVREIVANSVQGEGAILWALQLAAKLYELLVIASLSAIILHHMKYEILFSEGVPLGIFGSALSFQQLSYLWSREYWAAWAAVNSKGRSWRLVGLLVFLATCTFIAALVGPYSAVLVVPHFGRHAVGETKFANESHLFPDRLGSRTDCVGDELRVDCPAGGIRSATTHSKGLRRFMVPVTADHHGTLLGMGASSDGLAGIRNATPVCHS